MIIIIDRLKRLDVTILMSGLLVTLTLNLHSCSWDGVVSRARPSHAERSGSCEGLACETRDGALEFKPDRSSQMIYLNPCLHQSNTKEKQGQLNMQLQNEGITV